MILILCFIDNKNYDSKMIIPTERESYHNLQIWYKHHNIIFDRILQPYPWYISV